MDENEAQRILGKARDYVGDDVFSPYDFDEVGEREFLEQYLWTIFSSGFRWATLNRHFDGLASAFHDFDLDKIVAMDGIDAGVLPIRNQRKADAFLAGCRMVHEEGWNSLKERIRQRGRHGRAFRDIHPSSVWGHPPSPAGWMSLFPLPGVGILDPRQRQPCRQAWYSAGRRR